MHYSDFRNTFRDMFLYFVKICNILTAKDSTGDNYQAVDVYQCSV